MCGIAGILRREPEGDDRHRVSAMQHALRHRGPDDGGNWQSGSRQATFATTRLAILDLTPAGHQPMSCADGRLTITFNGEIYNFKELRHTLEGKGISLRSQTDTEVILRAYEAFGEACVGQLRGMFAFASRCSRATRSRTTPRGSCVVPGNLTATCEPPARPARP